MEILINHLPAAKSAKSLSERRASRRISSIRSLWRSTKGLRRRTRHRSCRVLRWMPFVCGLTSRIPTEMAGVYDSRITHPHRPDSSIMSSTRSRSLTSPSSPTPYRMCEPCFSSMGIGTSARRLHQRSRRMG